LPWDPAGISPELTARLLALDDVAAKARLVVIGDRRVLDDGARVAAVRLDLKNVSPDANFSKQPDSAVFIDLGHLDPSSIAPSTATAEGGQFALTNYFWVKVPPGTSVPRLAGRRPLLVFQR
jgi:4-hydroxythreonine-4-phosphate dehydrogenase